LKTNFWKVNWHGGGTLAKNYPRLFSISSQKEAMVGRDRGGFGRGFEFEFHLEKKSLCVGGRVAY